jgi:hemerythrin superfamily protein
VGSIASRIGLSSLGRETIATLAGFASVMKGAAMADARIFEDLKADHDRHRALLERIADAGAADRAALFETFRVEVTAHAAAEEESLYATMLAIPDLRDAARHSVSEHKEIDDYFGELAELDIASEDWTAKFKEMRHRYEHHIGEEEEEMFPSAAARLSADEEQRLAAVFERRKPRELARAEESAPGDERE